MFWTKVAYAMAPANPGASGASGFADLGVIILMIGVFYFLLIRPQQKKAKEHKSMLSALKRGDKVITAGGLHGRILEVDADTVTLDLGNSTVTLSRGFISVVNPTKASEVAPAKGKKGDKAASAEKAAVAEKNEKAEQAEKTEEASKPE
jgi:preprotein translocase, YajC subunit